MDIKKLYFDICSNIVLVSFLSILFINMNNIKSPKFPVVLLDQYTSISSERIGMLEKCRELGWRMVDLTITMGVIPEGYKIIGAIIGVPADHHRAQKLINSGYPLVRVGSLKNPLDQEIPAVITDNEAIGKMAAEHFSQRNFKHIGYIGHKPWSMSQNLYEAFKKFADEKGVKCHLLRFGNIKGETKEERYQRRELELKAWLESLPKPVGIFTYNDFLGSSITTISQAAGLSIPEQVAILSCGNNEQICETTLVPISSIDIGRKAQAKEAVSLLHQLIEGKSIPESPVVIPPVGIIERESTDILAVPNELVVNVLKYIWNNLELQLSIDDIARQFGISRSILDHSFNRYLGRSPSAERLRKRLERCAELLRNSNLTIAEIAHNVGFTSVSYLHRSFRKEFGTTLRKYRTGKTQ